VLPTDHLHNRMTPRKEKAQAREWSEILGGLDSWQEVEGKFGDKRFMLHGQLQDQAHLAFMAAGAADLHLVFPISPPLTLPLSRSTGP
jgi:hypothetical protein